MEFTNIKRIKDKLSFNLNHLGVDYFLILLNEDIKDSVIAIYDFDEHKSDVMMGDEVIFQVNTYSEGDYFELFFDLPKDEQDRILTYFFLKTGSSVKEVIEDWLDYTESVLTKINKIK